MKIAFTSQGYSMEAPIDKRFGRAKNFVIYDEDTEEVGVKDNSQNLGAAQGAGVQASQNVADLGVGAIVTGNVGPKAFSGLNAAGIDIYIGAEGTVKQAYEAFKAGKLQKAAGANVGGHW
ncbi:MAG: NifB/NifX family molybdenum-iron cluster-binding protein [Fibrobacterota bacterium]